MPPQPPPDSTSGRPVVSPPSRSRRGNQSSRHSAPRAGVGTQVPSPTSVLLTPWSRRTGAPVPMVSCRGRYKGIGPSRASEVIHNNQWVVRKGDDRQTADHPLPPPSLPTCRSSVRSQDSTTEGVDGTRFVPSTPLGPASRSGSVDFFARTTCYNKRRY